MSPSPSQAVLRNARAETATMLRGGAPRLHANTAQVDPAVDDLATREMLVRRYMNGDVHGAAGEAASGEPAAGASAAAAPAAAAHTTSGSGIARSHTPDNQEGAARGTASSQLLLPIEQQRTLALEHSRAPTAPQSRAAAAQAVPTSHSRALAPSPSPPRGGGLLPSRPPTLPAPYPSNAPASTRQGGTTSSSAAAALLPQHRSSAFDVVDQSLLAATQAHPALASRLTSRNAPPSVSMLRSRARHEQRGEEQRRLAEPSADAPGAVALAVLETRGVKTSKRLMAERMSPPQQLRAASNSRLGDDVSRGGAGNGPFHPRGHRSSVRKGAAA
jgi:hypothetical protein